MFCWVDEYKIYQKIYNNMKQYLLLALTVVLVMAAADEDKVTALNGYYDFTGEFQMYSGYLTLQEKPQIANHYLFITSKDKPETDDLVLWLNGGPGCSSLLGTSTSNLRIHSGVRSARDQAGRQHPLTHQERIRMERPRKHAFH